MAKKTTKFLIWDFDGTLGFRQGGWTGALHTALHKTAPELTISAEQIRPHLQSGFPWHAPECEHSDLSADDWWTDMQMIFLHAYREAGVEAALARKAAAKVRAAYLDLKTWECFPDSIPALDALQGMGWQHLLLTNHIPELGTILDHLKLTGHFATVLNSAETGWEKPNGHAFRLATDWITAHASRGAAPEIWVIGDHLSSDIRGAQEAGLPAILVRKKADYQPFYEDLTGIVKRFAVK